MLLILCTDYLVHHVLPSHVIVGNGIVSLLLLLVSSVKIACTKAKSIIWPSILITSIVSILAWWVFLDQTIDLVP